MKDKGQIIYISVFTILVILLLVPAGTTLFSLEFSELKNQNDWLKLVPDILSILVLTVTYPILRLFYTKRSKYVKWYPLFAFIMVMTWTAAIQLK